MTPVHPNLGGIRNVSLADEETVKEIVAATVMNLWEAVDTLTRLRPSRRERYRVAIFGSARAKPGTFAYTEVKRAAAALTEMGCDIVTGGGPGLMQAANEGAASAGNRHHSTGIRVELPFEQETNPFVEQVFSHKTFFSRLHHFVIASDAFVVAPGGIGTVLETLMIWQLLQVRHVERVPLILVGPMWKDLVEWARKSMLENADLRMANPRDLEIPKCFDSADEAIALLREEHDRWRERQASTPSTTKRDGGMNWLLDLYTSHPAAQAIALISIVCMAGMLLGSVKVRGIGLGTAGVLFAGVLAGAIGQPIDGPTLAFVKEFGLILFVFGIGLQLGPGFVASLRGTGVRLNILAASIVVLGALIAAGLGGVLGLDPASVPGVFAGATTHTPSLGAAQQTLAKLPGVSADRAALPALAYTVTYPAAILGMIATILVLKSVFRLDPRRDAERFAAEQRRSIEPLERRTLVVANAELEGVRVDSIGKLAGGGVIISRVKPAGDARVRVAVGDYALHTGDLVLAVGTTADLDRCEQLVGSATAEDLMRSPGPITHRRIVVTSKAVLGKTVGQLGLQHLHGVVVTRVTRGDLEMTAVPQLRLQFGDTVHVVGEAEGIRTSAEILGDSLKALNQNHWVPLFGGVVLAIALGTLPIPIPGMPQPLRLGIAAGSLIVSMLIGRLGRLGPLASHMPFNANLALRDLGIALFFASVGLLAGPAFFKVVFSERGLLWMAAGVCVTMVPLLAVGAAAIHFWKLNFVTLSGLLAGSMTDPPALAFATNLCDSDAPMTSYAAVYPLTTLLRILAVQILTITLCG